MTPHWHAKLFDGTLDTAFEISEESGRKITAILMKVDVRNTDRFETMSVLFKGPKSPVLSQNTHTLRHPVLGEQKLFLGPVGRPEKDGIIYEAVFNRLK